MAESKGCDRRTILGWRCLLDVLALLALGATVLVLQFVTPFTRGFFCLDDTIVYPFKPSTITSAVLIVVSVIAPLLLMAISSIRLSRFETWCSPKCCVILFKGSTLSLPPYLIHFFHFAFVFLLGGAINQLVTDVGKVTIGRLRPNFISVCKPNYTAFNCTNEHGVPQYVLGNFCTGVEKDIKDSRKSWPSGHSSSSAYAMIYAVLYIEYCRIFWRMPGVRNLLNIFFILFTFCCILSRIDDNKHHWSDVLSGAAIGVGVAITMFWTNFPLRDRSHYLPPSDDSSLPHGMYQRTGMIPIPGGDTAM